jgi:hypothetical protein
MTLRKGDAGKVFIAPSGRRVLFVQEKLGVFMFVYQDDPTDGLALSPEALHILERAPAVAADPAPVTRPMGVA